MMSGSSWYSSAETHICEKNVNPVIRMTTKTPDLLESPQSRKYRTTYPSGILPLWGRVDFNLDIL